MWKSYDLINYLDLVSANIRFNLIRFHIRKMLDLGGFHTRSASVVAGIPPTTQHHFNIVKGPWRHITYINETKDS